MSLMMVSEQREVVMVCKEEGLSGLTPGGQVIKHTGILDV
jgi:hypothetical protein